MDILYKHTEDDQNRSLFTLKEMQTDEQPREKLMNLGPEYLSDSELLAILFRSGTRDLNALDLGRSLLQRFNGLHGLKRKTWQDFKAQKGMGDVKALVLEAALELARRLQKPEFKSQRKFTHPKELYQEFAPHIAHLPIEHFIVVFMDGRRTILSWKRMSTGSKQGTLIEPSEVIRMAILERASAIVLIHNHPNHTLRASKADICVTDTIVDAAKLMRIDVDDHIIIAGANYVSMKQEGLLKTYDQSLD